MFRNFTFEAASRHPSTLDLEAERAAMNVSPTSQPYSPPPYQSHPPTPTQHSPVTMGDLAQQFSQQNLRVEVDPAYQGTYYQEPPTPPADDGFSTFEPQHSLSRPASCSSLSSAALRLQRQKYTQWQCNASNVKDLSVLVEKMVDNSEQCIVCTPIQARSGQSSDEEIEDEGVDIPRSTTPEFPSMKLHYRRSGERLNGQACVSKNIRIRRKKHRRESSNK